MSSNVSDKVSSGSTLLLERYRFRFQPGSVTDQENAVGLNRECFGDLANRCRRRPFGVRHVSIISRRVHCPCPRGALTKLPARKTPFRDRSRRLNDYSEIAPPIERIVRSGPLTAALFVRSLPLHSRRGAMARSKECPPNRHCHRSIEFTRRAKIRL